MEKISYTKDELKFIDNCAHCIATSDVGHILTINGVKSGIHKDISKESCKDQLFKLDLDEFDTIRRQFDRLVVESVIARDMYIKLIEMFYNLKR